MPSLGDTPLQSSLEAAGPVGSWRLAPGQALSLYPRQDGVLRITAGRVWATLDQPPRGHRDEAGDHCLQGGEQLAVRAGQHLVFEPLDPQAVWFEWVPAPAPVPLKVSRWEAALLHPLADLARAGRLAASALLRLGWGLLGSLPWLLQGWLDALSLPRRRRS